MAAPEGRWELVIPMDELRRSRVVARSVGSSEILCVHERGETYVWSNVCPHKLGPLAEGRVAGHEITCPWHSFAFDLRDGQIRCGPTFTSMTATPEQLRRIRALKLRPVPHRVDDGGVWLQVGDASAGLGAPGPA